MSDIAGTISEAYATKGAAIDLGRGVHDGSLETEAVVKVPLRMMNRHGLIAGAKILEANETQEQSLALVFHYDVEELLTQMGIGEAAVTILSEDGVPTPVVRTRLRAPASRIGPADDVEGAAKASPLFAKYGTRAEAESPREKLAASMEEEATVPDPDAPEPVKAPRRRKDEPDAATARTGGVDMLGDFLTSREGNALEKKVMRGVFGMLRKSL